MSLLDTQVPVSYRLLSASLMLHFCFFRRNEAIMAETVLRSDLMKPEALAAEWLISTKTLANLRSRGEGPPFVRVLGSIRYSRQECAEWLAARNSTSA